MNVPIRNLRPSVRQLFRRDISRFRHGSPLRPWDEFDWRCFEAADRLDLAADRRDAIAAQNVRPLIEDEDEWSHGRTVQRERERINASIFRGGEEE